LSDKKKDGEFLNEPSENKDNNELDEFLDEELEEDFN
jgi:hypothetical protein